MVSSFTSGPFPVCCSPDDLFGRRLDRLALSQQFPDRVVDGCRGRVRRESKWPPQVNRIGSGPVIDLNDREVPAIRDVEALLDLVAGDRDRCRTCSSALHLDEAEASVGIVRLDIPADLQRGYILRDTAGAAFAVHYRVHRSNLDLRGSPRDEVDLIRRFAGEP